MLSLTNAKRVAYTALFIAFGTVLNLISFYIPSAGGFLGRPSLVYMFCYLCGIFLGPLFGGIAAASSDLLQAVVVQGGVNFVPQLTVSNTLMAVIPALFYHKLTFSTQKVRLLLSVVVCFFVCSLGISAWGEAVFLFDIYPYGLAKLLGRTLGISSPYLMLMLSKAISQPVWVVLNTAMTFLIVERLSNFIVYVPSSRFRPLDERRDIYDVKQRVQRTVK